jgi:hypothetical protein
MRCPYCHIGFVDEAGICSNAACSFDHEFGVAHNAMNRREEPRPLRPVRPKLAIVPVGLSPDQRE